MRGKEGAPLATPLVPTSTFHVEGDPALAPFTYARMGNPTWAALEEAHARIDGAGCVAFASGMAASAAVLDGVLPLGGALVAPSDAYYTVRLLIQARGITARLVPSTDPLAFARAAAGAAVVWVETPTNPGLAVVDVRATAEACRAAGALLVVDNTLATAQGQDVFALGADVAVISATKSTSGHSDALIGLACTRDAAVLAKLRAARTVGGGVPGVLEAWLCLRGLATLDVRLARTSSTALLVATEMRAWDALHVADVRYPGLRGHPGHDVAARQMRHFGPVLTFDVGTAERAERLCARLRHIAVATSFGGVETTLERRARWGGDAVSPGLIRMSVGLEDAGVLLDDLMQALR